MVRVVRWNAPSLSGEVVEVGNRLLEARLLLQSHLGVEIEDREVVVRVGISGSDRQGLFERGLSAGIVLLALSSVAGVQPGLSVVRRELRGLLERLLRARIVPEA